MTTTVGTERVPLEDLTPFEGNARRGNVETILDSLRANGQYKPLVVRRQGETLTVLAGNHTLLAMLRHEEDDRAGCRDWELSTDRPCQVCIEVDAEDPTALAHLIECDDSTATRINLVDNKAADDGGYDDEALAALLASLDDDLVGTGYAVSEADLFGQADAPEFDATAVPAPVPPAEFPSYDEDIETEHRCPKCGYEWSGKSR
ncbi:ParB N-terminal domain-containing protein [Streptomyces massasporeus]|uniref:ParB N-terminal domain-containing protein n=1 Tax=Streptomyces massasporeus TaxID=67324 RepID=UPI00367E320B